MMKRKIVAILLSAVWISVSEFVRNEFLLKSYWTDQYESMGLVFPSAPINGAVWVIWSLFFAISIYFIAQKFTLIQTTLLAWLVGFVLMWLVVGNMNVLPFGILPFAVPLSFLEAFIASYIVKRLAAAAGS
jgi:hypothetical protein